MVGKSMILIPFLLLGLFILYSWFGIKPTVEGRKVIKDFYEEG